MLPVLPRLPEVEELIEGESYFILHAPRQTGKTTYLKAVANNINSEGQWYTLCCSLEASQGVTDDDLAMTRVAVEINTALQESGIEKLISLAYPDDALPMSDASVKVRGFLKYLSMNLDKDLIIFFDEADCRINGPLIAFLCQIRIGYNNRYDSFSSKFPRSLALVGLRDIRDYITKNHPEEESSHLASPFNVKKEVYNPGQLYATGNRSSLPPAHKS
jgi:hypothetical protein